MAEEVAPHLPRAAAIEAYGNGGFRFAGMSHRGSLLCLPNGVWAWPVVTPADIAEDTLSLVFAAARDIDVFLIGSGREPWHPPEWLAWRFRDFHVTLEVMQTGPAVRTYNILLAERRRIGAAFIAVD